MNFLPQSPDALITAAEILNRGGIVIIPTDTVYGIAARPDKPEAVARIAQIKGRPTGKPIALLTADERAVAHAPESARKLMRRFWPGALTLVIDGEGYRVPNHDFTRELIRACGGLLRVTSANLSGAMPALSAAQALEDVGLAADLVIDGGTSPGGTASSVVSFDEKGAPLILREGAISKAELLCI